MPHSLAQRNLRALLATPARQRMAVLSAATVLLTFAGGGFDFLLPLWVTRAGYTASQFAQLRSLRFTGVLVGVILLGALSDRFGQRRLGALSLFGVAAILAIFGLGWKEGIWLLMPIFGALMSTVYVNLNTLIQGISARRQGVANTIYRAVGAAAGIGAPIGVTWLAYRWHGYPAVLFVLAVLLAGAGAVLLLHPDDVSPAPLGPLRQEVAVLWAGYAVALRQRGLMAFIHLSQLWVNLFAGVGAFAAIRFTRQLGQTDEQFGVLGTCAGVFALLATIGIGIYLDRISLRKLHGVAGTAAGVCCVLLGATNLLPLSMVSFILFGLCTAMLVGPSSMWVSRAAGAGTQTAVFSVQKVVSALYLAVSMWLVGMLEPLIGMRLIMLYGGILGTLAGVGYFFIPDPPPHPRMAVAPDSNAGVKAER